MEIDGIRMLIGLVIGITLLIMLVLKTKVQTFLALITSTIMIGIIGGMQTLPAAEQAFRAISTFKDEYLLDYINVEELGIRDRQDVDERVVENAIIHNMKNFILSFGKDFAFVRNQYHLDAFGEDQYIDLLFFNRELNC